MKKFTIITCFSIFGFIVCCKISLGQTPVNWTAKELTQPAALAATLKANKDIPVIFSVGPGAVIPNSIDIGMVKDEKNLAKFKEQVSKFPKSANILIYCGCCPFEHCPNVRPAIALLHDMQFTNYHLLDLPHNIKADWIDKGFPTTK